MILVLALGSLFFLLGIAVKKLFSILQNETGCRQPRHFESVIGPDVGNQSTYYFDAFDTYVGFETNSSLEAIFDIIIDRYILLWYNTLSNDQDFLVQVKMYLQHVSAVLIHRAKRADMAGFTIERALKIFCNHVEHIFSIVPNKKSTDSVLEDAVLRALGSHLHISLASRSSELTYLRALVIRLLPIVSFPPGLDLLSDDLTQGTDLFDAVTYNQDLLQDRKRKSSLQLQMSNTSPYIGCQRRSSTNYHHAKTFLPMKLGTNRAAFAFLVEILATCVLLPAMDAIANPDFINKVLLQCFSRYSISQPPIAVHESEVPVLNSYVHEWRSWISNKPCPLKLSELLRQQDAFYPFMQYMKSVKATSPATVILLMHCTAERVRSGPLSADDCREIRAQVEHILELFRNADNSSLYHTSVSRQGLPQVPHFNECRSSSCLFNLPSSFEDLLESFLAAPTDPQSVVRLIYTPVWNDVCRAAFEAVESRFLPLYVESPEFLSHHFGVHQRNVSITSANLSPVHNAPQSSLGFFGIPLKTIFSTHTVEGHVVQNFEDDPVRLSYQIPSRPPRPPGRSSNLRDRAAEVASADLSLTNGPLTIDTQHQLHSHYMLRTHQIDMSDWRVFIPGLSRPEVQPGRRLIDQLVPLGSAGLLGTPLSNDTTSRTQYSTRPHDGGFRTKVTEELNSLHSNSTRAPMLSPQFLFTVRTEHLVNGTYQQIARVDRKYSEFYVLEQKLLEFHGDSITQQLPRKQLTPRSFEFLESKREQFEDYLQFLVRQPFLRSSELLHSFLTSKSVFNTNILFELNFGRFAKSVPLKLIRERGQYLDDFLVAFYVSCNPQPIVLEPPDPQPSEPARITVLPSAGVGTLGGIDALASPEHYSFTAKYSPITARRSVAQTGTITTQPSRPNMIAPSSQSAKRNWLENRLRLKIYWNNAGLPFDRRKELYDLPCEFQSRSFFGTVELPLFTIQRLFEVSSDEPESHSPATSTDKPGHDEALNKDDIKEDVASVELPDPVHPWDISHGSWGEALLNGPLPVLPVPKFDSHPPNFTSASSVTETTNKALVEQKENVTASEVSTTSTTVSISWADLIASLQHVGIILRQYILLHVRLFILWILRIVGQFFVVPVDWWLESWLRRHLYSAFTDQFLASGLGILKAVLFYPSAPSTESEKMERKAAAHAALNHFVTNSRLSWFADPQRMEQYIDRLFMCFQHPKWNKQLTYALLDQLTVDLFPELRDAPS